MHLSDQLERDGRLFNTLVNERKNRSAACTYIEVAHAEPR